MSDLDKLEETVSKAAFGMTKEEALKQGLCLNCKKPPTFYSEAGKREYKISGLCEPCFDNITLFE